MSDYTGRHVHPKHRVTAAVWRGWSRQIAAGLIGIGLVLALPSTAHAATVVTVHRGDTQHWITNPDRIYPGQRIRLTCTTPAHTSTNSARATVRTSPITSGWVNPLPGVGLTSCFGDGRHHMGIDMDGYMGQPVRAASAGVVSRTGQIGSGYGNEIVIRHSSVWSHYAHLSRIYVRPGQSVAAGQVIGAVGNSGAVVRGPHGDGSHLHFEIATKASVFGSQVNPAVWLRAHGVNPGGC